MQDILYCKKNISKFYELTAIVMWMQEHNDIEANEDEIKFFSLKIQ